VRRHDALGAIGNSLAMTPTGGRRSLMMGWMISTGYGCDRARPYGGVGVHAICMRPDGGSRGGFFPDDRAPWAAGEPDKRTATASLLVAGETTRPARRALRARARQVNCISLYVSDAVYQISILAHVPFTHFFHAYGAKSSSYMRSSIYQTIT
jgi:hypothetical protein